MKKSGGKMSNYIKSPIHYMGNKFDLLPQLIEQFPSKDEVETFMMFSEGVDVLA